MKTAGHHSERQGQQSEWRGQQSERGVQQPEHGNHVSESVVQSLGTPGHLLQRAGHPSERQGPRSESAGHYSETPDPPIDIGSATFRSAASYTSIRTCCAKWHRRFSLAIRGGRIGYRMKRFGILFERSGNRCGQPVHIPERNGILPHSPGYWSQRIGYLQKRSVHRSWRFAFHTKFDGTRSARIVHS